MHAELFERRASAAILACALLGCSDPKKEAIQAHPTPAAVSVTTAAVEAAPAPAPGGCKAAGATPTKLGTTVGSVLGLAGDATHLYFVSWQLYGSRGNLGKLRKDGGGADNLTSLSLEPRALAVDDQDIFYSEGIRLMKISKAGGSATTIAPKFSSLSIAIQGNEIFGVPGEYGPYDRLVKVSKSGGINYELDVVERPEVKLGPVGYNAIAADAAGVYVTDSGKHRVLRFQLERAKPKVLATGQPKAFDLATDGTNVYFTLAEKGLLLQVPKAGGAVKKLASGLVSKSRIAVDDAGLVAVFAGPSERDPVEIAKVPSDGGARTKLASVEGSRSVEAVALDKDCVYWADRTTGSGSVEFYAVARQ